MITTAEGGLQEIDNMVQRIRELAVQAANDTNDYASSDRKKLQDEIDQLTQGIDNMTGQVEFNKKRLLDGSYMDKATQSSLVGEIDRRLVSLVGSVATQSTAVLAATAYSNAALYQPANDAKFSVSSVAAAGTQLEIKSYAALASTDLASGTAFDTWLGTVDASIASMKAAKDSGDTAQDTNLTGASKAREAALRLYAATQQLDGDITAKTAIKAKTGVGMWLQTGANSAQGIEVGIGSVKTNVLGIGDGVGNSRLNINQKSGREIDAIIDRIDDGLQYVTSQRAKLGAISNRLDYTQRSLDISSENLSGAESRIRDTDMAKEMIAFTKANVLNQAGISMLSQANQAPQSILSLLR